MGFLDFWPMIGSLASGVLNNAFASERQEDAQDFSAVQYASRYQTTVEDMRKAGLNPGLAYGGISGSPPVSSAASSSGFPDLGAAYNESRRVGSLQSLNSAQQANIEADTRNKDAQGELLRAQAAAQWSSADQSQAMTGQIGATVRRIMAEIPKINEETLNLRDQRNVLFHTAEKLKAEEAYLLEQGLTQNDVRAQLRALAHKLVTESALMKFDIEAAEAMGNLGRGTKQLQPIFDILRSIISSSRGVR